MKAFITLSMLVSVVTEAAVSLLIKGIFAYGTHLQVNYSIVSTTMIRRDFDVT